LRINNFLDRKTSCNPLYYSVAVSPAEEPEAEATISSVEMWNTPESTLEPVSDEKDFNSRSDSEVNEYDGER